MLCIPAGYVCREGGQEGDEWLEKWFGSSNRGVLNLPCPVPGTQDQRYHDSLLSGPHGLSFALLAAEISSAQAVSVPSEPTVTKVHFVLRQS